MKKKLQIQLGIILAGTIYSWANVLISFQKFYGFEGTIFKFKDCFMTNPLLTPCFWGALAFVVALVWSLQLIRIQNDEKLIVFQKRLTYFLAFGTVFAFSVFGKEVYDLYTSESGQIQTCIGSIDNPFKSSCLYGGVIYLISLLHSLTIKNGD